MALQRLRRKKMAAVHFTTILCEPYTTHKVQRKSFFFCNIRPCTNGMLYVRNEDVTSFLCVFMRVVRVSMRQESWVNVSVAMFLPTKDW